MPYLVDGHNLIPKLGLRLDSIDDEESLVLRLQEFCRLRRARVEVYFDGAPPGHARVDRRGALTAHFVRQGSSADSAIEARLAKLGRAARNWTVVSSDGRVQAAGRASHAEVLSSDQFALKVKSAAQAQPAAAGEQDLSPEEVDEWLGFFKNRKG